MEHHMRIWHSRPFFSYMIKSYLLLHVKLLWKICIIQLPPPPRPPKPPVTSATSKAVAAPTYPPPRKFNIVNIVTLSTYSSSYFLSDHVNFCPISDKRDVFCSLHSIIIKDLNNNSPHLGYRLHSKLKAIQGALRQILNRLQCIGLGKSPKPNWA